MTEENVSATTTISASAETVFAVLADPSPHAAVDGTGRVRDSVDGQRLTGSGQIFRVAMYHENHYRWQPGLPDVDFSGDRTGLEPAGLEPTAP